MSFTVEEARTLEIFARSGSIAKTAEIMHKASSAIVYALDSIEEKSGIPVFDRSKYRTTLLPSGERLLETAKKLLHAADEMSAVCSEISNGWEPDLKVIVEGVVPMRPVFQALRAVSLKKVSTRFHVYSEHLSDVAQKFEAQAAHFMITLIPPADQTLESLPLFEVPAILVAAKNHPVLKEKIRNAQSLARYPILTVRGSDPRLATSTAGLELSTTIQLNDFHAKKEAILAGLGFGWLPEYLIQSELKAKSLVPVPWPKGNRHLFHPHLYHRGEQRLGRAAKEFIKAIQGDDSECSK